jgi:hypothetical protein
MEDSSDWVALALAAHLCEEGGSVGAVTVAGASEAVDAAAVRLSLSLFARATVDPHHSFTAVLLLAAAHGGPPSSLTLLPPLGALATYGALCGSRGALCAPPPDISLAVVPAAAALFARLPAGAPRAPLGAIFAACLAARPPALPAAAACCGGALLAAAAAAVCAAGAVAAAGAASAEGGAEALAAAMAEAAALCGVLCSAPGLARGDAEAGAARTTPGALKCLSLAAGLLRVAAPLPQPLRARLFGAGQALQECLLDLLPMAHEG